MSDDFLRLVSQANPATRQYQPTNNGYPPSSSTSPYADSPSNPQLMDPFFDDDDELESTYSRPMPMQSQESGLPLAHSAAPPAGTGNPKGGDGVPQGWNFDDDDFHPSNQTPFGGSDSFNGSSIRSKEKEPRTKTKRQWKWPWKKEKQLTGERIVALNNSAANVEFSSNFVSTSKYNLAIFLPKFLFGEFQRLRIVCYHSFGLSRAILEIRQHVLFVHGLYTANTRRFSDQPLYDNCSAWSGVTGFRFQGSSRGFGAPPSVTLCLSAS